MIKALITSKVTLTAEPGSVVIISEGQFKALGGKAVTYKDEAKEEEIKDEAKEEEIKEEPKELLRKPRRARRVRTDYA
jgi:hypothetical protein